MANMFQFVDWAARDCLRLLKNKSRVIPFFNTDFEKDYKHEFAIGETVRIKFPQRFTVTNGLQYNPQSINRKYTTATMNQVLGIHFQWDDVEAALKMERSKEEIRKQYFDPAMTQMASELDSRATLFAMQNTNNIAGVLGTTPNSTATYMRGRTLLNENSCPEDDKRCMITSPQMLETYVAATTPTQFNPTDEISRQYRTGSVGKAHGFDWYESMQLYSQTAGTWAGAVTVSGANQSGSSISISDTNGDTFNVGDVFSIASVNNVNPLTRRSTNRLKTFVVTSALTGTGGPDTLNFYPPIIGPGDQYQNVDSLPTNGAALTLFPGTASPNGKSGINGLAFHRDAFALVSSPLEEPKAVEFSSVKDDPESGIHIRIVRAWDPVHSIMTNRIECLMGFGVLYADNCSVRILSNQ